MNKNKYNEMVARKAMLEGRLKAIREHQRRSSISYLIEDVIEKASAAMVAKDIVDHFSKMAEDTAKIEGDDLMPMMDTLKASFGPTMAQNFQSKVSDQLRQAVQSLTQIKDAISTEVSKLEAVANGQAPANDMATDPMADPAAAPAAPAMADPAAASADPLAADPLAAGPEGADPFGDEGFAGPAGRAKKESAIRRGKKLNEGLLDSIKSVLTAHFDDVTADRSPREQLEALKPFITASDYEIASQFPDHLLGTIFDRTDAAVGMTGEMGLPAVPAVGGMDVAPSDGVEITPGLPMSEPAVTDLGSEVHDEIGSLEPKLKASDLGSNATPSIGIDDGMDDDMDPDLHDDLGGAPLDMPFESAKSPARRLRESKNPDAVIYRVFAKVVQEGARRNTAAKKVAETFGLDLTDVVSVIREAEQAAKVVANAAKPGRDWKRIYAEGRADGLTKAALITLIAESSVDKRDTAVIRTWITESEKQDAIFGKKSDKTTSKSDEEKAKSGKPWEKKDCDDGDTCDKEKVEEADETHRVPAFAGGRAANFMRRAERVGKAKRIEDPKDRDTTKKWTPSLSEPTKPKEEVEEGKIGLDRHLQRKLAAAKDKNGKVDPAKNPYGKTPVKKAEKVSEAEGSGEICKGDKVTHKVSKKTGTVQAVKDTGSDASKHIVIAHTDDGSRMQDHRGSFTKNKSQVSEAEGDVGFQDAISTPMKYPEASNPAFKSNSGKGGKGTDKTETPMVVGGKINPTKGNPAQAGKMAGAKVEESDTGFPTASNKDKGFPEADNPGYKKNTKQSGKNDPAGKSLVAGKKTVAEQAPVKKK